MIKKAKTTKIPNTPISSTPAFDDASGFMTVTPVSKANILPSAIDMSKSELESLAKTLVIPPGAKLVYDKELNKMVWK